MNRICIFLLSLLFVLSGCGGGGGSAPATGTSPGSSSTFPVTSAMSAFLQAAHSYTMTGVSGSTTITLQYSITPGAATTFEGQQASTFTSNIVVSSNNGTSAASQINYYNASPFYQMGTLNTSTVASNNGAGQYTVYTSTGAFPVSNVSVGYSWNPDSSTTYTDSTKSTVYATDVDQWTLYASKIPFTVVPDSSGYAWVCDADSTTLHPSSISSSVSTCFKIDTTGNVSAMSAVMLINGGQVVFQ